MADNKRSSAEALMRRLDNERSYLRSQLTSEVTLKLELQNTLDVATKNLGEIKQTYANERDTAEVNGIYASGVYCVESLYNRTL